MAARNGFSLLHPLSLGPRSPRDDGVLGRITPPLRFGAPLAAFVVGVRFTRAYHLQHLPSLGFRPLRRLSPPTLCLPCFMQAPPMGFKELGMSTPFRFPRWETNSNGPSSTITGHLLLSRCSAPRRLPLVLPRSVSPGPVLLSAIPCKQSLANSRPGQEIGSAETRASVRLGFLHPPLLDWSTTAAP